MRLLLTIPLIAIIIYTNLWQDKAIAEWNNDTNNLVIVKDGVYMEKYWSGSLDYDPRIKLAKKELDVIRLYCYVLNI